MNEWINEFKKRCSMVGKNNNDDDKMWKEINKLNEKMKEKWINENENCLFDSQYLYTMSFDD